VIVSERENESGISAPTAASVFDAGALFNEHRNSVVRLSDSVSMGPNQIDNTRGSGFVIDRLDSASGIVCRIATDNHVIAQSTDSDVVNLYVGVVPAEEELEIDDALGLQLVSIHLQKSLITDLKELVTQDGLGYQPYLRQVLTKHVRAQKKLA
jgi:hypothetical protein